MNSKRQRKPKAGKPKDNLAQRKPKQHEESGSRRGKQAQRKLKRVLRKSKSQQKAETNSQRHQEYKKTGKTRKV